MVTIPKKCCVSTLRGVCLPAQVLEAGFFLSRCHPPGGGLPACPGTQRHSKTDPPRVPGQEHEFFPKEKALFEAGPKAPQGIFAWILGVPDPPPGVCLPAQALEGTF